MEAIVAVPIIIVGLTSKTDETLMTYYGVILKVQVVLVRVVNGKDVIVIMIVMGIGHVMSLFSKRLARAKVKRILKNGVYSNGGEEFWLSDSEQSTEILYDAFEPVLVHSFEYNKKSSEIGHFETGALRQSALQIPYWLEK